jgi:hypothetical protein
MVSDVWMDLLGVCQGHHRLGCRVVFFQQGNLGLVFKPNCDETVTLSNDGEFMP